MQSTRQRKEDRMFRFTRYAVLVVVAAAVLVPAGQAMTVITDNSPSQNHGGGYTPYVHSPGLSVGSVSTAPDALARYLAQQRSPQPVSFTSENASTQNRVSRLNDAEAAATASGSSSFAWDDAGIGAGMVGIVLLVGGAMVAVTRRSQKQQVAL